MIPSSSRNAHNSNGSNHAAGEASVTCAAATTFETEAMELNGNQLAIPGGEDKESCMDSLSLSQVNETKSNHQHFIKVKYKKPHHHQ